MRSVDANVLVRIVARDDERQTALADSYVAKGAWISHLVLAETTWVLARVYGLGAEDIAKVVEMLVHHESLSLQDEDTVGAALEHYRRRPALGFSDCLILEVARKAGHVPLATFDRNLARLDGAERLS